LKGGCLEVADEVSGGLAELDCGLLRLVGEELVVEGRHLAVGAHVVLLEGLLEVGMLVEQGTDLLAEDVD
jgi:hypothetical protein